MFKIIDLVVSYIVICPIFSTPSSPKGNPIGWSKFSTLSKLSKIPVYALGGVSPNDLDTARNYGATGIAAIRSLWLEDNVALLEE